MEGTDATKAEALGGAKGKLSCVTLLSKHPLRSHTLLPSEHPHAGRLTPGSPTARLSHPSPGSTL